MPVINCFKIENSLSLSISFSPSPSPFPSPFPSPSLQRQYIFIHDAVLELIQIGDTEISIQNLRKTYQHLQSQNPDSETSGLEEEFLVSVVCRGGGGGGVVFGLGREGGWRVLD